MLKVKELSKSYKKKKAVQNLSFEIQEGEIFCLLGRNGAGKSTTIKMILGLVRKDGGDIEYSQDSTIGYSPETPYFPPFLTGKEVLTYYGKLQKVPPKQLQESCTRLLNTVGLADDQTKVSHYSKGMLQRLAFAQALLGDPDILIFDEPCAGLDAVGRIEMLDLIQKLKQSGKTILLNSHILTDMEKICDRGIILDDGKCIRRFEKADFATENLESIFQKEILGGVEEC